MPTPSRLMPPVPSRPMTWTGTLILSIAGAGLVAVAWLWYPASLAVIGGVVALAVVAGLVATDDDDRLARLASGREGESICSFARSFDCRSVDSWAIRAVFDELQPYCRFGGGVLPLRAADSLEDVLRIDPEDLDDMACTIADRSGRSMEGYDQNPFYDRVRTASDLVLFLVNQPFGETGGRAIPARYLRGGGLA